MRRARQDNRPRRRPLSSVYTLLLTVLIAGAVAAGLLLAALAGWHFLGKSASPPSVTDLELVSPDAQLFAHARLADLLATRPGRELLDQFRKNAGPPDPLTALHDEIGLDLADIDRVSVVSMDVSNPSAVYFIIATARPVDPRKLPTPMNGQPRERQFGGRAYRVVTRGDERTGDGWCWVSDQVLLTGPRAGLEHALRMLHGQRTWGAQKAAIQRAGERHHLVLGVVLPPVVVQYAAGQAGRSEAPTGLRSLAECASFTLVADVADTLRLEGVAQMTGGRQALDARKLIERLGAAGGSLLPDFKNWLVRRLQPTVTERTRDQVQAALGGVRAVFAGATLTVRADCHLDAVSALASQCPPLTGLQALLSDGRRQLDRMEDFNLGAGVNPDHGAADGAGRPSAASSRARLQARHRKNLRDLAFAMRTYMVRYNGEFPPAMSCDRVGRPLYSWRVELLPYLGQQALFDRFHKDEPWDGPNNIRLLSQMPDVFATPGRGTGQTKTCYQVFVGTDTPWPAEGRTAPHLINMRAGAGHTILIAEAAQAVEWTRPQEIRLGAGIDPRTLLGKQLDPDAFYVATADTWVRRVPLSVSDATLRSVMNPADARPPGTDWPPR
jgi:hypothetical protein